MKRILINIQEKACALLLLTVLAATITSCDSVLGYEEDCDIEYRVKFKYDYNMDEVDVFSQQVRTVTLYAYDNNNKLIYQKTDEGEQLGDNTYSMQVGIDPTQYHLIVWAGLNDQSFAVPLLPLNESNIEELKVKTLRKAETSRSDSEEDKGKYVVEQSLHSLWHGEVKNTATTRGGRLQTTTVGLVKNTNTIRVIVAQVNNSNTPIPASRAITKETFACAIYDDNGYMNYDNSILEDNLLTYKPYSINSEVVTSRAFSDTNEPAKQYNAMVSDMSFARLMADKSPQLTIKNKKTDETLFNCANLVKYFEMVDSEIYKDRNYSLQEYLDREDEYVITIFVDEQLALIKTVIEINAWVIHLNDIEL